MDKADEDKLALANALFEVDATVNAECLKLMDLFPLEGQPWWVNHVHPRDVLAVMKQLRDAQAMLQELAESFTGQNDPS